MRMGILWNDTERGKTEVLADRPFLVPLSFATDPTWTGLRSKQGLRCQIPATNTLNTKRASPHN